MKSLVDSTRAEREAAGLFAVRTLSGLVYYWHHGNPISPDKADEIWEQHQQSGSAASFPEDPVIDANVKRLIERARKGMVDYGVSMQDAPGGAVAWIDHTIEELLDAANYLEKLKRMLA